tara:strand:- start:922 stop:1785 length:864 start_codon:yes stop_codon:yes gene_type:complete
MIFKKKYLFIIFCIIIIIIYYNFFIKNNITHFTNNNINNLTIGIKTFIRPKCLDFCIRNIVKNYPNIKIIIGDDSDKIDKKKNKKIINKYSNNNIIYIDLPFDSGISKGRNEIVKKCKTDYILILDDSRSITKNTQIDKMLQFLIDKPEYDLIGGVIPTRGKYAGNYDHYFLNSKIKNNKIIINYTSELPKINYNKLKVYECNLCNNIFIAKTKKLKKYKWDDKLKVGEHELFFYNWYKNNNKCAISYKCEFIQASEQERKYKNTSYRNRTSNIYNWNDKIVLNKIN